MATSGEYVRTVTVSQLCTASLRKLRAVDAGDGAETFELDAAMEALDFLLAQLQGPEGPFYTGLKMWLRERLSLDLKEQMFGMK